MWCCLLLTSKVGRVAQAMWPRGRPAGGGGRGMRLCTKEEDLMSLYKQVRSAAQLQPRHSDAQLC
jgi:hypothetical protein